ncbi:THxN family PEP-CTERM protein [Spirulina subsalsa FACHB-351]|uniref:THxN family PEP-CTERM protein n=1 Tax=Spirulina subsalsa FACHB-351 TaxID=234711 RepID=A0ABT3L6H1_9CYAN|nr:THxN family PEP-CTERM protein [Spirulina subsalsa]MCW6037102.1 THxN family PEP-CTERM protein [Spirulina subsalsa FACHB-351]
MSQWSKLAPAMSMVSSTVAVSLALSSPLQAASFTIDNITGTWFNLQGTSVFNGVGTDQVRWGDPATLSGQSGLNFQTTSSLGLISSGSNFVLGELTHLNFPVWGGTAASGVDLLLSMAIDGVDYDFNYTFTIDETPNVAGLCPDFQISTTPCDDKIDFTSPFSTTTFVKNGFQYTLELLGFSRTIDGFAPVSSFITEEYQASSAFLVARVTKDPNSIPEPNSLLGMLLLALASAGIKRRGFH